MNVTPKLTKIFFDWDCPYCNESQMTFINFHDPWVAKCDDCAEIVEIDDSDIIRTEDKEIIAQITRIAESYCNCNSPEIESDSTNCRICGKTVRSYEYPFKCLNCGNKFHNVHPLVTHTRTDMGHYHKEIFCCPACEDHYYSKGE